MNWKCKFGFHDWQYISAKGMSEFVDSIRYPELANGYRNNTRPLVYKRICLICLKYEDTMTPLKKEIEEIIKKEFKREQLAIRLLKEIL
jgi:hypothetical protein